MKKIILASLLLFASNITIAQCLNNDKKPIKSTYILNNNLIEATIYHDNGALAQTGSYTLDNKLQGEWRSYDISGNLTSTAQYNNGVKVGTWFFYQGVTKKEVVYNNSMISQVNTWTKTDSRVVVN
jgi:antitoxin component YwqK of YwqJK toxin-antitoxin module